MSEERTVRRSEPGSLPVDSRSPPSVPLRARALTNGSPVRYSPVTDGDPTGASLDPESGRR